MDIYQPDNIYQEDKKINKPRYQSADHTPIKIRFDNNNNSFFNSENRGYQTPKDENLQDLLSSQKLRWAKKGSMKLSYLEDPSYNFVHSDMINQSFFDKSFNQNVKQFEHQEDLENSSQKKNNWTNNIIKVLMKQKEKSADKTSQQFFDQMTIKQRNEINLQKMSEPPKYKLFQTSIQKRNLPPVKLKQLQYLQYFEEKKKNFPHLTPPLNEIFVQIPDCINNDLNTSKQTSSKQSELIRNHIQKETSFIFQDQNSKSSEKEAVLQKDEYSYINKAIQFLENNSQKFLTEKHNTQQSNVENLNTSPVRKLPRVFGQRNASPLNRIIPSYKQKINQQELKLSDLNESSEQKNNFYVACSNPQEKSSVFSIKQSQVSPRIKNLSLNFSDQKKVKYYSQIPNLPIKTKQSSQTTKNKNTNEEKKFNFEIVNQSLVSDKTQKFKQKYQNYNFNSISIDYY